MQPIDIVTYEWVPAFARGFVRDLRVRWAAEEAGLPYRIETTPVRPKAEAHRAIQPFEQVPVLKDGAVTMFESGAILWRLGERSPALMPPEEAGRAETMQWLFAALNSVEPLTNGWVLAKTVDKDPAQTERAAGRMTPRLAALARVVETREHIAAGRFTIADIALADVLRLVDSQGGLGDHSALAAYLARQTARPGFRKAFDDQMAHWAAADARRAAG